MTLPTDFTQAGSDSRHLLFARPKRDDLESAVRSSAIVAARGEGVSIPEGVLNFIVASSDWSMPREALMNRAARMAEYVVNAPKPINFLSATRDEMHAYFVAMGRQFGMSRVRVEAALHGGGGGLLTSARFDGLTGAGPERDLARMRYIALHAGLHWAADRPEILRMGEEAIRLFARTHFSRESFDRLKREGFERKHILNLVKFAERTHQDVNEVAKIDADSVRVFGGGSEAERRRWIEMIDAYHGAPPGDTEARGTLTRELERMKREGTPEQKEQADRHLELIQHVTDARLTADAQTAVTQTAEQREAAERAAREARERAEVVEAAAAEAERRRLTALMGGDPVSGDSPAPSVQEGPAPAPEHRPETVRTAIHATAAPRLS